MDPLPLLFNRNYPLVLRQFAPQIYPLLFYHSPPQLPPLPPLLPRFTPITP